MDLNELHANEIRDFDFCTNPNFEDENLSSNADKYCYYVKKIEIN